jgi:hypothetical protein
MPAKSTQKRNPTRSSSLQIPYSTAILGILVVLFVCFSVYQYTQLQVLNNQIANIDTTTISARTSYFLQAKEGFFMDEAVSDLNNRDDFKKVLFQAPKVIDSKHPIPIKARIWGKVSSVTFTLKDGNGTVLGTVSMKGSGEEPTNTPKINTRYLNALYNIESDGEIIIHTAPQTSAGIIEVFENTSDESFNRISTIQHRVVFAK